MTRAARPAVGYGFTIGAAGLFALNGTVSTLALEAGLPPTRLTALRCAGAGANAQADGRTERGQAAHSPIRCHCDHWNDVEEQAGLVGGERRLINRLVSRAGAGCRV